MKTPITIIQAAIVTFFFLFCSNLAQATVGEVGPNYVLFKEIKSNQTGPGAGSIALGNNPYRFDVLVQATSNGSIASGTVSLPAGSSASSPQNLASQNDGVINDGTYAFQDTFVDQATLDSNYADGTYSAPTGNSSASYNANLSLTGQGYPSLTPTITNTNWINGSLAVDATSSFTLTWGAFTGSTGSDRIGVGVGRVQDGTATFQVLPASATSVTFPANYFQTNDSYKIHIVFVKVTTTDTFDISGSTGFAGYGKETRVTIQTTGSNTGVVANISTRSFVQTGDNVMIAGFIVQDSDKTVVVRAIGPSLGVPNSLPDPKLEIHDITGALIARNNDWQTTQIGGIITADQSTDIQNTGLQPNDPKESAILAQLPPGNYTAIVVPNTTNGVGLVEVYTLQ